MQHRVQTAHYRHFTWVIIVANVLMLVLTIAGFDSSSSESATGLGFAINLFVWAAIDVVLCTLWIITNDWAKEDDAPSRVSRTRERALQTWARFCPFCLEIVQKNANVCGFCGRQIHAEAVAYARQQAEAEKKKRQT